MSPVSLVARTLRREVLGSIILIALVGGLAGGIATGLVAGASRTRTAADRFIDEARVVDMFVLDPTMTQRQVDAVRKLPGVEGAALLLGVAAFPRGIDFVNVVASVDGRHGVDIDVSRIVDGRAADPRAADEIVVTESIAKALDLEVGDTMELDSWSPDQTDKFLREELTDEEADALASVFQGPQIDLEVVGISRHPADLVTDDPLNFFATLSPAVLREYRGRVGEWLPMMPVDLGTAPAGAEEERFTDAAREILGTDAEFEASGEQQGAPVVRTLEFVALAMLLLGAAVGIAGLVVAGLLAARSVSVLAEDTASLAPLGMTASDRARAVMAALSPSVLGAAALAAIVAVASSAFMPFGLAGRAEPDPGMRVDPPVLVIGVAATLLLLGAAVVLAAARAVRADAGAARASRPNLSTRLAHAGMPVPSRFGVHLALGPARAGGRGANRAAIAGVALATAAGVGALVVGASVDHLVSTPAAYGWTWDFTVLDDTARRLADDPEVASASVVTAGSITLDGRPMPVRGIEQVKGDVPVRVVDGRHPGPGEVVLGSRTMDSLDVRIGDTVVARGIEDEQELRIVGEAVLAGVVDIPEAGWGAAMTASDLEAIGPDGEDIFSVGIVSLADGVDRERFAARVEAEQGEPPELAEEPVELSRLHEIEAFPYALFAFLALVGFVAIAHAVVLTARRRGGDLAVLRSMGMARRGVYRAVSVQALVLAVIGGLVGIPLGLLAARALWRDLAESIGVVVEVDVPWPLILGVGVAAIGGLSLFARLPGRRVARARPAAILRAE